jgi:hypothetical protein
MLSGRILLVAFEGWNDATEAASGALKAIAEQIEAQTLEAVDPEDYYDFQFSRPMIETDPDGNRILSWPGAELLQASPEKIAENPNLDRLYVLLGAEPSRRWLSFSAEILEMIQDREIDAVIMLGAMLADAPHTRPMQIFKSSPNKAILERFELEPSSYEGPVGIVSTLGIALEEAGIATIALWAAVPHYVHTSPSPKATLALVAELERLLGVNFSHGDLADQAFAWERGIDEIAENDEEMSGYIEQLEASRDEVDSEAASGEAIARELEKFLQSEQRPPDA